MLRKKFNHQRKTVTKVYWSLGPIITVQHSSKKYYSNFFSTHLETAAMFSQTPAEGPDLLGTRASYPKCEPLFPSVYVKNQNQNNNKERWCNHQGGKVGQSATESLENAVIFPHLVSVCLQRELVDGSTLRLFFSRGQRNYQDIWK